MGKNRYRTEDLKKKFPAVRVVFYDHTFYEGSPESATPMKCEVFGILWKEDTRAYYISSWISEESVANENNDTYVILKETVESVTILVTSSSHL